MNQWGEMYNYLRYIQLYNLSNGKKLNVVKLVALSCELLTFSTTSFVQSFFDSSVKRKMFLNETASVTLRKFY